MEITRRLHAWPLYPKGRSPRYLLKLRLVGPLSVSFNFQSEELSTPYGYRALQLKFRFLKKKKKLLQQPFMYVCLSVRVEKLENRSINYHETWYWGVLIKLVDTLKFWVKVDSSNGHTPRLLILLYSIIFRRGFLPLEYMGLQVYKHIFN
jgi:hypothetical protein